MKKIIKFFSIKQIIILTIIILIPLFLLIKINSSDDNAKPIRQKKEALIDYIPTTEIKTGNNVINFSLLGVIKPKLETTLSAEISGQIINMSDKVYEGEYIKKDELLLEIDPIHYENETKKMAANLAAADTILAKEEAEKKQAIKDLERAGIKRPTELAKRSLQVNEAKANKEAHESSYSMAKSDLLKTKIRSPFSGVISSKDVNPFEHVSVGSNLFHIISLEELIVQFEIPENILIWLKEIPFDVFVKEAKKSPFEEDEEIKAPLIRMSPSLDADNRTREAFAEINSKKAPFLIESVVNIKIPSKTIPNTVWINSNSIIENSFIWAVDEGKEDDTGSLKKLPVSVIYNEKEKSLIRFIEDTPKIIARTPASNFFVGKKVSLKREDKE